MVTQSHNKYKFQRKIKTQANQTLFMLADHNRVLLLEILNDLKVNGCDVKNILILITFGLSIVLIFEFIC